MWPLNSNSLPQWFSGNQPFSPAKPNSNFINALAQAQTKPGPNMPWGPNMGGFNPGPNLPNANLPFQPTSWQPALYDWKAGDNQSADPTKGDVKEARKSGPLSGKGSIDGVNFRSGDGERYELKVEAGKSYNLLSDAGIGLNGTYGTVAGETVLTDIALNVGGKIVTLANDGTLRVDGKAFDKRKNNLGGLVTENKDGTYTVKANGYEFELKASQNGIKVKIDAKNARTPEGLWGVALDGEKNTEKQLQKAIRESDYRIENALTFDYEDNNNIGEKYIPDLDDEERNELAWNARNPQLSSAKLTLNNGKNPNFSVQGPIRGESDDAYWTMNALQANRFYNVFSDEGIQVNGKFSGGKPTELGFLVDGDEVKVVVEGGKTKVTVNGEVKTSYDSDSIKLKDGVLTIKSGDSDDENYSFTVRANRNFLDLGGQVKNIGANDTRSSGLLGDAISGNIKDLGSTADNNGAGYLRNQDGSLSKAGANMTKALREYMVDDLFDTSSGRSVYD